GDEPDEAALRRLLQAIDPGLTLDRAQPLAGGVSARVTRIDAVRPDGSTDALVVRQYGAENLRNDPRSAAHEYELLARPHPLGVAAPRPRHADESGKIIPAPYLVTDLVDGTTVTEPGQVTGSPGAFTQQVAATLASIHQAGVGPSDVPYLREILGIATARLGTGPASLDAALDEGAVRAALSRAWPPPQLNQPGLLHGDYWPGNILWRNNTLVGVIDWEDAVVGDPLADVAHARMELTMAFGLAAASEFTTRYTELMPSVKLTALAHWDLYAALRHAGRMTGWGLSPAALARLQAGHREFTTAVLGQFPSPWPARQNGVMSPTCGRSAAD
ncbi:MAG TPA: phosphotransferase, partial [Chloroflexota bacterium]